MTVRRQLRLVRYTLIVACIAAVVAIARYANMPVAWLCAVLFLGASRPLQRWVNRLIGRRAFVRLRALLEGERYAEAHAHLADLRRVYAHSASALELLRVHEGSVLGYERRYADAVRLYESIDRRKLSKETLPWLLHNLAMCLARLGDGARAVAAARDSIEQSGAAGDRMRWGDDLRACQLGVLGTALFVDGKPSEAVGPLEQALARGGTPRQQAGRSFYLGEALHTLGREDEARAAWKRAAGACPGDELASRAAERLDSPAPPYRS